MRQTTFAEAINEAMREEMQRDESVFLMGEEVGMFGGVYGITKGLMSEFGAERVRDTPISEQGFVGAAVGAAIGGLKPVVEVMYADFLACCLDQIINSAAKMRFLSGGQLKVPLTIRTMIGRGRGYGGEHAQVPMSWFMNVPGLNVVVPSTPCDAKGLLKTAIREEAPVLFFEPYILYKTKGKIPTEEYTIPFGQADIKRKGDDLTIIAISAMVPTAIAAAEKLQEAGISAEVIDPRTLVPLDVQTIVDSVKRTRRAIIVEFSHKTSGVGAEISSILIEKAFDYLDAPIARVAAPDTTEPACWSLADLMIPKERDIIDAAKEII